MQKRTFGISLYSGGLSTLGGMKGFIGEYQSTRQRVMWHTLFWIGYIATYTIIYGSYADTYKDELFWTVAYLPMKMAATYFVLYYVLPKHFLRKQYVLTAAWFILAVLFAAYLQRVIDVILIHDLYHQNDDAGAIHAFPKILKIALGVYPVVAFAAFVKLAKYWYEKEKQAQQLKQQKLEAELNFLKGQIHPHFLFNTLNNLYALTLKKSDASPEVVLKLSELLSFMLYECNSRSVSLDKELKLVENYIDLERIRYDDRLKLKYEKEGDISSNTIPPMLLLPFVENAFKHGTSGSLEEVKVEISVKVDQSTLYFEVKNTKPDAPADEEFEYQKGIGLKNVSRRLELLYNGYYSMKKEESETSYTISLTIQLDKMLSHTNPES